MTDALATLGVLAVVSTSALSPWTNAFVLVVLAMALAVPESWQTKPFIKPVATLGPLLLFAVEAVRLLAGHSGLDVAVEFAVFLQVIRLATRRGAAHDQQIIVIALLHFVAGTVLGGGLSYGLCFIGFLIVAPGALVLSHLRREVEGNYRQGARDRTGLPVDVPRILRSRRVVGRGFLVTTCFLSIPIFLFTAMLFVMFPRVGLSLFLMNHQRSGRMVGFSDHVDLGSVGVLRSDPSIALRFDVPDLPEPRAPRLTLRLRGTAFDAYDGKAWSRTQTDRRTAEHSFDKDTYPLLRTPDVLRDRKLVIDLESIDPPVVFLPPRTVAIRVRTTPSLVGEPLSISRGPEGELRYSGSDAHGLHYETFLARDTETIVEPLTPTERLRYLAPTQGMPDRVRALAHEWTDSQPTPLLKAKAIEEHLKTEYRYDTNSPSGGKPQPVDDFLFDSRRGHCEFFSTSMAILLREVGIPSRNVTGFVGGTYNRFGRYYAVREGDAHSWVEAYLDENHGWTTFEPTPTAGTQPVQETAGVYVYVRDFVEALSQRWNRYVVGYDLRTQTRIFEGVSRRYDQIRAEAGISTGFAEKATKPQVIAAIVLFLSTLGYFLWKRRRSTADSAARKVATRNDKQRLVATSLYRSLEQALAAQGLARPTTTPPLKHAEEIVRQNHTLADEILALTTIYLEARFGTLELSESARSDFETRIKAIRSFSAPVAA